jgi:hypothetical protein
MEIMAMMQASFLLGSWSLKAKEMRRIATGVKAFRKEVGRMVGRGFQGRD